jgi:serine/threonine protein kinase
MIGDMAGKRMDGTPPRASRLIAELAAAGFADAVEIGRGGAGVVYRCHQTALGRSVAIKVMASDLDEHNQERFLREGFAMGGLSGHPNIESVLQVGVSESGRPYIVMPYHAAGSLAQRLRRSGRIPWPDALRIGVKLCGALETAHRAGTLHRDIKPANILVNDYGEPQLSDFGIARVVGGYETATGVFSGTIAYTAHEVLAGNPPTVVADVYSLGATIYALIAGNAAHERKSDEDLIAHYLRIGSTPVPDMRPEGIPADVCAAVEKAMSHEPADRYPSAAEFGRELQLAQRHNGLIPDSMPLSEMSHEPEQTAGMPALPLTGPLAETDVSETPSMSPVPPDSPAPPASPTGAPPLPPPPPGPHMAPLPIPQPAGRFGPPPRPPRNWKPWLFGGLAAAVVALLVIGGVFIVLSRDSGHNDSGNKGRPSTRPTAEAQAGWRPITDARVSREGAAATQADGTIWIFGGLGSDMRVTGRHEGYDPAIDSWKGGDDLPVPVRNGMAVTWQSNPVVLGGWRTDGANQKVATDRVWRVINSRWVELPPLLQPRAAAAAAVVGDRIVVAGGVDANGRALNTTEIFDGTAWKLGAPMPTPRQMLAGTADDKLVYVVGGNNGTADLTTVEAYDPTANTWTSLPDLAEPRSDFGVAVADNRLVAVGGVSSGKVVNSVGALVPAKH